GALECHWCGVHNAAQGGRCKPLRGKSRGCVAWRREVECYTESETSSATVVMTQSVSASSTMTLTLTMSSTERSETNEDTVTASSTLSSTVPHFTPSQMISPHSLSYSESAMKSNTPTASISHKSESDNTSRTTTYFSKSTVTPSDSRQLSVTVKTPTPTYMHTSSLSQTVDATATNYYYRQWTALDKVVAPLASGLQFLGIGGATTSVTALSRVVASRSVGQCWGQAGSSMLNAAVALCGDLEVGDVDQQEFQGDAIGSLGLTIGVVGVVVLGWVAYGRVHSVSIMTAAEDLSLVTLLSPLWMVIIPVGLGGAAVTVVAPVSTQHPLATTCDGTIGLVVAVALVTIVQLVGLVVIPLLVPTMCGLICTVRVSRLSKPSGKGVLKRLLYFVHLNSERQWEWAPTSPSATRHRLVRTLLLETHVLWYSAFDATVIAVVSVLGAVGPLLAWSACVGVGVAVAVLFGTQLVIVALARPCNRRVDDWMCVLTLALSTTSVTLRVVYGAAESDDERRNREDLLRWASALDLLLTILSALPLLPSFVAGLRHCYAKALNPRPRDTVDEEHSDTPIESWRCDPVEELEELNTLSSFTPIVVGMSTEESLELPLLQRMVAHKHANKSRSTQPIIISAVASTDVLVPSSTAEAHDADMLHHFVSPSITHLDLETEIRRDGASHVSELIVAYQQHQ
ncbi:transmembrane protein, putative, partial [Bodo saltans]